MSKKLKRRTILQAAGLIPFVSMLPSIPARVIVPGQATHIGIFRRVAPNTMVLASCYYRGEGGYRGLRGVTRDKRLVFSRDLPDVEFTMIAYCAENIGLFGDESDSARVIYDNGVHGYYSEGGYDWETDEWFTEKRLYDSDLASAFEREIGRNLVPWWRALT